MIDQRLSKLYEFNRSGTYFRLRAAFWALGTFLATIQAWSYRYHVSADAVSYMDMSDGVLHGQDWHRLVNAVWSPLYPFLLGVARRVFEPGALMEIPFDHVLNIPILLFAFACFEFLLSSMLKDDPHPLPRTDSYGPLPKWAFLTLAYALFLWASITQITLKSLRPDMLMSGFVYLAVAIVLQMRGRPATWGSYLFLGLVLGIGFLAKAPVLPIGLLILGSSLFLVDRWRAALPMVLCSALLVLLIGSVYFLPLSRRLGHFTLGESASFNYMIHVNHMGPAWYFQTIGSALGQPLHRPRKIFEDPAAYEFSLGLPITHPLRFEPSYWTRGVRPGKSLRIALGAVWNNLRGYRATVFSLGGVILGFVVLCLIAKPGSKLVRGLLAAWPLWLVGLAGLAMYTLIHVENRYCGVFFVLLWLGLFAGVRVPLSRRKTASAIVIVMALSVLAPMIATARSGVGADSRNTSGQAARELPEFGIHPGDPVARISDGVDLGWARIARATIVAEVDWQFGAQKFCSSDRATQNQVLQALARTGARGVIARCAFAPSGWQRLGNTQYWIYRFQD